VNCYISDVLAENQDICEGSAEQTFHTENIDACDSDELYDLDDCECIPFDTKFDSDSDEETNGNLNLTEDPLIQIRKWVNGHDISQAALGEILDIMRPRFPELPKDPRTVMKLDKAVDVNLDIRDVSGGQYYHFGIADQVTDQLAAMHFVVIGGTGDNISLQINIDGVPLFKSTNGQLWPILGKIDKPVISDPFVIGLFYGLTKPVDLKFLEEFVTDYNSVSTSGIMYGDAKLSVSISALVCDAPARALIKNCKMHNAYSACERCSQPGEWKNKMVYPEINAPRRTDISFQEMQDPDHHHGESPIANIGLGMVSQFVLDYMHLVCLGVVRRLIWLWLSGPTTTGCRIGSRVSGEISDALISLKAWMPKEFARKPRSLSEWQRWKATEFRQFLLYTGPIVLCNRLSGTAYQNFLLLSVSMVFLLNNSSNEECLKYAEDLLILFVEQFSELYGPNMLVYNVHNLIHLADDARKYGSLDNVSAFCFENYLGKLVKLVRKPHKPLQQLIKRLLERKGEAQVAQECISKQRSSDIIHCGEHQSGVIPQGVGMCKQFKSAIVNGIRICTTAGDNCVTLGNDVILIKNILLSGSSDTLLVYQKFTELTDFFTYPLPSSDIGIYKSSGLSHEVHCVNVTAVVKKNVMLPYMGDYVMFPLIHM
jgi:predicted XRE-type DNA-binding protein